MKMRAAVLEDFGKPLEVQEIELAEPRAGEVLVRVRATSLNRGELLGGKPGAPAKAGGGECAGEVVKLGEGVTGVAVGDRLMGRCAGGFAELALMDAREAMGVPKAMAWEEAAATPPSSPKSLTAIPLPSRACEWFFPRRSITSSRSVSRKTRRTDGSMPPTMDLHGQPSLRVLLRDELGVAPSEAVQDSYLRLLG